MSNLSNAYVHPILTDQAFNERLASLTNTLQDVAPFWRVSRQNLYQRPADLVAWLKTELGASKTSIKWLLPLCTPTTARNLAQLVFGRDLSPIEQLGTRPVSSFIRFLLFERQYSVDAVRKILIDDLGYPAKTARPLIRRIERDLDKQLELFTNNKEATLFHDITFA